MYVCIKRVVKKCSMRKCEDVKCLFVLNLSGSFTSSLLPATEPLMVLAKQAKNDARALDASSMTQSSLFTQPADAELQLRLKNPYSGIFWRGHHALAAKILHSRVFDRFDRVLMLKVTASAHFLMKRRILQLTGKRVVYSRFTGFF